MPLLPFTSFRRGLFKNVPRHEVPDGGAFILDDMTIFKGEAQITPGFKRFNVQVLVGSAILLIDELPLETGISHLLALTDDQIRRFNTGTSLFDDITRAAGIYTGGLDDAWVADIAPNPAGDLLYIFTNGVDNVQKWDGDVLTLALDLGGGPHVSKAVVEYQNHLLHLNLTEAGTPKPRKLKWSDNGAVETYTGGTSGFLTLFQGADHGVAMFPIGSFLAVYRDRSIHLISFIGAPFFFGQRQVISGVGLLGPHALLNLDNKHVFLGNDNVYLFNAIDLEPIGDEIRDELFDTMDPKFANRSLIFLDEARNLMMLVVPTAGSGGIPDTWWCWSLTDGHWSGPVRGRKVTGGGAFQRRVTETWDSSSGSWDTDSGPWDSARTLEAFPVNLFGNEDLRVFEIDSSLVTADGVAVTGRLETGSKYPGVTLFDEPSREAICISIRPLMSETNAASVSWFVGVSDNPVGPFTFHGPFKRGVRGVVNVKPITGKWFIFAVEHNATFRISGLLAEFERAGD